MKHIVCILFLIMTIFPVSAEGSLPPYVEKQVQTLTFRSNNSVMIKGGNNQNTNYAVASEKRLQAFNDNNTEVTSNTTKSYFSFNISDIDWDFVSDIRINLFYLQGMDDRTVEIYFIPEGLSGNDDIIDQNTLTWANAPHNAESGIAMAPTATILGAVSNLTRNEMITLSSQILKNLAKTDTNDILTFALVKTVRHTSTWSYASSRSTQTNSQWPTLEIDYLDIEVKDIEEIKADVLELNEGLKKSALLWYVREAELFLETGDLIEANEILADVENALPIDIALRGNPTVNILPEIEYKIDNPYILSLEKSVDSSILKYKNTEYLKGMAGYLEFSTPQQIRNEIANRLDKTSFLFCQTDNKYSGDSLAAVDILKCFEALFTLNENGDFNPRRDRGDGNMNRFIYSIAFQSYLEVVNTYPDLILPYKRYKWENNIQKGAAYQYQTYGTVTNPPTSPSGAGWYPNMDAAYIHTMEAASMILGNLGYKASAADRSVKLESLIFPGGGLPYLGYANETPTYHQVNIDFMASYYLLSGNMQAKNLLEKTIPYYPDTSDSGGLFEYSSTPYWKHYWDEILPYSPEIIAGMFENSQNRYVAQQMINARGEGSPQKNGAIFYNPEIAQKQTKMNTLFFDYNIMGQRAKYDNFSYVANGRDWKDDRGKFTFVGAMILEDRESRYPLNSALQVICGGVYDTPDHAYMLAMNDKNSITIADDVSVFTTNYLLQSPQGGGGRSSSVSYGGTQSWLMLPDRVIGFVETESLINQTAYGMQGVILAGTGRGSTSSKNAKMDDRKNTNYLFNNNLRIKIFDQNYCNYVISDYENWSKYINTTAPGYMADGYYNNSSGYVTLTDTESISEPITYSAGDKRYYIMEALETGTAQANSIKRTITQNGLYSFRILINAQNKDYMIIQNNTDQIKYFDLDSNTAVYHLADGNNSERLINSGTDNVTIQPYGHVFIDKTEAVPLAIVNLKYGNDKVYKLENGRTITAETEGIAQCILALYKDGVLADISLTGELELSNISDGSILKAFPLSDTATLTPYDKAVIIDRIN